MRLIMPHLSLANWQSAVCPHGAKPQLVELKTIRAINPSPSTAPAAPAAAPTPGYCSGGQSFERTFAKFEVVGSLRRPLLG